MKGQVIRHHTTSRDAPAPKAEPVISLKPCCEWGKQVTGGYYGSWEAGGSCSRKCETAYADKQRVLRLRESTD